MRDGSEQPSVFAAVWTGPSTTSAPSADDFKLGAIGCNQDGIPTANIYHVMPVAGVKTWVDTTQTVAGLYGV